MNRFFRRLTVIFIIIGLLICSITGVFAVTRTFANDEIIFELGAVIVSLESNSPSVESLLPGFNIAESRLITPGFSTQKVYHVVFSEKTEEIVRKAIEVLNASPYVKAAEPNYYMQIDPVEEPTTVEPTDNGEQFEFELGAVLVSLQFNSPSVESLLPGFNIAESRLITPGSSTQKVYHVKFVEKSEDIVWRAIEVLNASPYVKVAEPNYLMEIDPDNPTTPVILGDADGDGVLSIVDATCIQRYLAGLITESDINLTSAKVAGNSTVTILDATTIQRKLAGLPIS